MDDVTGQTHDEIDEQYAALTAMRKSAERNREWLRVLFEPDRPVRPSPLDDPVDAYLDGVLERARLDVTQLREEIDVRRRVHEQAGAQLDYELMAAAHSLTRLANWGLGYNRGVDQKRAQLEDRLQTLRHEKRLWHARVWKDVVDLRTRMRAAQREYDAALRRSRLGVK
jgi:hypothetical protein